MGNKIYLHTVSVSSSFVNSMYARCNLTCGTQTGPKGTPTSVANVEADLGTTHDEPEPWDSQLVDEPHPQLKQVHASTK